jgi:hypothetical protein
VLSPLASPSGCVTKATSGLLPRIPVWFAGVNRRTRITCALPNPELWVSKSVKNLLFHYVATIIDSCIKPAMKWHGGTISILKPLRSQSDFGTRAGSRPIRLQLKNLTSSCPRIHPRHPHVRTRANYQTKPIDARRTPWLRRNRLQLTNVMRPRARAHVRIVAYHGRMTTPAASTKTAAVRGR